MLCNVGQDETRPTYSASSLVDLGENRAAAPPLPIRKELHVFCYYMYNTRQRNSTSSPAAPVCFHGARVGCLLRFLPLDCVCACVRACALHVLWHHVLRHVLWHVLWHMVCERTVAAVLCAVLTLVPGPPLPASTSPRILLSA